MITADKVHVGSDRSGQDDFAQANTANADGVVPMSVKLVNAMMPMGPLANNFDYS